MIEERSVGREERGKKKKQRRRARSSFMMRTRVTGVSELDCELRRARKASTRQPARQELGTGSCVPPATCHLPVANCSLLVAELELPLSSLSLSRHLSCLDDRKCHSTMSSWREVTTSPSQARYRRTRYRASRQSIQCLEPSPGHLLLATSLEPYLGQSLGPSLGPSQLARILAPPHAP